MTPRCLQHIRPEFHVFRWDQNTRFVQCEVHLRVRDHLCDAICFHCDCALVAEVHGDAGWPHTMQASLQVRCRDVVNLVLFTEKSLHTDILFRKRKAAQRGSFHILDCKSISHRRRALRDLANLPLSPISLPNLSLRICPVTNWSTTTKSIPAEFQHCN